MVFVLVLIIPLYDSINDNPTFGDISMHNDEELDEHFRNRIDVYADKHPTLLIRQLAERLRKEWNKIEEPEQEPVGIVRTIGGYPDDSDHIAEWTCSFKYLKDGDELYLAPPKREPLSDEEIDVWCQYNNIRALEKLRFQQGVLFAEKAHKIGV